jgi:phosphate-selective porin
VIFKPFPSFSRGLQLTFSVALAIGLSAQNAAAQAPAEAAPAAAPVTAAPVTAAPVTAVPAPAPSEAAVAAPPQAPVEATPAPTLPVVIVPVELPPPPVTVLAPAEEPHARLDYSDGTFYLRSVNDNMVFVPSGRMHIDSYAFAGQNVNKYHRSSNGTGLKANLFFRRFILEFGGLIRKKWFYWIGGNFAPTTVDGSQAPISSANVYDGFVGYIPTPRVKIYLGQYNAPFTMENVTSSRWLDMMERALVVRTLATPYNKADGLMVWGDTENKSFEYQVGVFGGDGMNRMNIDNRFDTMGRAVVRPLAKRKDALNRLHIGVGGRIGSRDPKYVLYDAPSLSTPGGYAFWSSNYKDAMGNVVHILPTGLQAATSAEVYVPFERFDVRGEFVYVNENRHEVADADKTKALRGGKLSGGGGYGQVSVWLLGTPRINGNPAGSYGVTKLPDGLGAQAPMALQLVLRGEVLRAKYDANSRGGSAGKWPSNNISVNVYQAGLNYWATKHVRLTAQYSLYQFLGSSATNQAVAPGVKVDPTSKAHILDEFSFRVGLAL